MASYPWSQVQDLDGQELYAKLEVDPKVTAADLRKAYRKLAKRHHPDRGGTAAGFAQIQRAFATLSDPRQREVYDAWAKELRYRYVPNSSTQDTGGEDMLLDEFEGLGLHCNPDTQLVVTCEVCRRPATKECWICSMKICEFCTMKRHWKAAFPLHWPLVNSNHMRTKIAKQELETKRIEDDQRLMLQDPNHRSEAELRTIRAFKAASQRMLQNPQRQASYDLELAQHYMWAQTEQCVFLAVYLPTGYRDQLVHLECAGSKLVVQPQNSPPVIDRILAYGIDSTQAIETFKSEDNRVMLLTLAKGKHSERWLRLFQGDPDGVRCMQPVYTLTDSSNDILMEVAVPFYIEACDVRIAIGADKLQVDVRNTLSFSRTYWRSSGVKHGQDVIEVGDSMWSLDAGAVGSTFANNTLVISLVKPAITEEESRWKKGRRQDYRSQQHPESMHRKGYRFFADDEDAFGLEDLLQAALFRCEGRTFVPAKAWQHESCDKIVSSAKLLSEEVQQHLAQMQQQATQ